MSVRILVGDALARLADIPDQSVQCCVTSPPYFGLRDYGEDGQIGLEPTPAEYVARLVAVFAEVRRVLRDDGVLLLNLGDSYAQLGGKGGQGPDGALAGRAIVEARRRRTSGRPPDGLKPKDLIGIPWRVAFALQADGWYLRAEIIWHKPSCMPESVTDRPTRSHEQVFLLAKSKRYFWDADAIREAQTTAEHHDRYHAKGSGNAYHNKQNQAVGGNLGLSGRANLSNPDGRNSRSVWSINPAPFPGAHFAVFPPALAERCIRAGTSQKGACPECGSPWRRVVERSKFDQASISTKASMPGALRNDGGRNLGGQQFAKFKRANPDRALGWEPSCAHDAKPVPCRVLDCFGGAGTTALVAQRLGRDATLIELSPSYAEMAAKRVRDDQPMFAQVTVQQEQPAPSGPSSPPPAT